MCWCLLPHWANSSLPKQTISSGHDVNSKWEFNGRIFRLCVSWWEDKLGVSQLCDNLKTSLSGGYPLFDFASAWSWCSNTEWPLLSSVHSPQRVLILDLVRLILVWLHITSLTVIFWKATALQNEIAITSAEFLKLKVNSRTVNYLLIAYYVANVNTWKFNLDHFVPVPKKEFPRSVNFKKSVWWE